MVKHAGFASAQRRNKKRPASLQLAGFVRFSTLGLLRGSSLAKNLDGAANFFDRFHRAFRRVKDFE